MMTKENALLRVYKQAKKYISAAAKIAKVEKSILVHFLAFCILCTEAHPAVCLVFVQQYFLNKKENCQALACFSNDSCYPS